MFAAEGGGSGEGSGVSAEQLGNARHSGAACGRVEGEGGGSRSAGVAALIVEGTGYGMVTRTEGCQLGSGKLALGVGGTCGGDFTDVPFIFYYAASRSRCNGGDDGGKVGSARLAVADATGCHVGVDRHLDGTCFGTAAGGGGGNGVGGADGRRHRDGSATAGTVVPLIGITGEG